MKHGFRFILLTLLFTAETYAGDDKRTPDNQNDPTCMDALMESIILPLDFSKRRNAPIADLTFGGAIVPWMQPSKIEGLPYTISGLNSVIRRPLKMSRADYLRYLEKSGRYPLWRSMLKGLDSTDEDIYSAAGVRSLGLQITLDEATELLTAGVLPIGPRIFDVIRDSDLGLAPNIEEGQVYVQFSPKLAMGLQGVFSVSETAAPFTHLAQRSREFHSLGQASKAFHTFTKGRLVAWAVLAIIPTTQTDKRNLRKILWPRVGGTVTNRIMGSRLVRSGPLPLLSTTIHIAEMVPVLSLLSVADPPGYDELFDRNLLVAEDAKIADWFYILGSTVRVIYNSDETVGTVTGVQWFPTAKDKTIAITLVSDDGTARFLNVGDTGRLDLLYYAPEYNKRGNLQITRSVFESPAVNEFLNRELYVTRHFLVEGEKP